MDYKELDTLQSLIAICNILDTVHVCGRQDIAKMDGCFRALESVIHKLSMEKSEKEVNDEQAEVETVAPAQQ